MLNNMPVLLSKKVCDMGNKEIRTQSCGEIIDMRYSSTSGWVTIGDVVESGGISYLVMKWECVLYVYCVRITADLLSGHFPLNDRIRLIALQPKKPFDECRTKDWNERHMELCRLFKDTPLP